MELSVHYYPLLHETGVIKTGNRVGSPTTTRVTPAGVTRITPGNSG